MSEDLKPSSSSSVANQLFKAWCFVSIAVLCHVLLVALVAGGEALGRLFQIGPESDLRVTLLSVGMVWAMSGVSLWLVSRKALTREQWLEYGAACVLGLLYLNVLRERTAYIDYQDYAKAAENLYYGQPLHARYLYPPAWATLLKTLVGWGPSFLFAACWLLNVIALLLCFYLLCRCLQIYGFTAPFSTVTVFFFLLVNVAVLRTLVYGQINLHVVNLILLCLVLYPRARIASAIALALAVHLKATPLLLVFPFVFEKDVRWLISFLATVLLVGVATVLSSGVSPYLDFLHHSAHIYAANGLAYRDNSIDSLLRSTAYVFHLDLVRMSLPTTILKLILGWVVVVNMMAAVKKRMFYSHTTEGIVVFNTMPMLLVFMMLVSPLVWEHHPVFVGLSYLVALRKLSTSSDWAFYGTAYLLEFLMPTFDFYPWSYGRLLSPLLLLWLLNRQSEMTEPSMLFRQFNRNATHLLNTLGSNIKGA